MSRIWRWMQKTPSPSPADTAPASRDDHNPLLELPNELLLTIADLLERQSQLLLSISCRRLRVLLNSSLDLSLPDKDTKLRFLKCLELGYPEHLVCGSCLFMFNWQAGSCRGYRCPRVFSHSFMDQLTSYAWCMQSDWPLAMSREVVQLIFRAHERGPRYGLPLSRFSTSGKGHNGVIQKNEARFVERQLLLASRWELDTESRKDMVDKAAFFYSAFCIHHAENMLRHKTWPTMEQVVTSASNSEKPGMFKCPFCECDWEVQVQGTAGGHMRITLNIWRKYGRPSENTAVHEQMFHRQPSSRIENDVLSQRDLRALFGSDKEESESARSWEHDEESIEISRGSYSHKCI